MNTLDHALLGLTRSCGLTIQGAALLRSVIGRAERYPVAALISSIGPRLRLKFVLTGWACELRVLSDGRRQIFSFALPGDVVIARGPEEAEKCTLVAITPLECVDVAQTINRAPESERAALWNAVNQALHHAHERRYEQILRLGRRSAVERVADLLLELHDRLAAVDLVHQASFAMPLTQSHLADALALNRTQVNRSLKILQLKKLAMFRLGQISGFDRAGLVALCRGA